MCQRDPGGERAYDVLRGGGRCAAYPGIGPKRKPIRSHLDICKRERLHAIAATFYAVKTCPLESYLQLAHGVLSLEYLVRAPSVKYRERRKDGDDNNYNKQLDIRNAFL